MLLMALGLTQGKYLVKQVGDRVLDRERTLLLLLLGLNLRSWGEGGT